MGLNALRKRALKFANECRKQLLRSPHEPGLNDEEFLWEVLNTFVNDIKQDIEMEKIHAEIEKAKK